MKLLYLQFYMHIQNYTNVGRHENFQICFLQERQENKSISNDSAASSARLMGAFPR